MLSEKTASKKKKEEKKEEKKKNPAKDYKKYAELADLLKLAQSHVLQSGLRLETKKQPIYSIVKQACLSGTPKEAISYTIKEASVFGEFLIDELNQDLKKDGIVLKTADLTSYEGKKINPENELVKKVADYHDECLVFIHNKYDHEKLAMQMPTEGAFAKLALEQTKVAGVTSTAKNLFDFIRNNKKRVLAATSLGAGTIIGVRAATKDDNPANKFKNEEYARKIKRTYGT